MLTVQVFGRQDFYLCHQIFSQRNKSRHGSLSDLHDVNINQLWLTCKADNENDSCYVVLSNKFDYRFV